MAMRALTVPGLLDMSKTLPLSHLTVLDLAGESGRFCGRLLAALGAHVIRVEKPGGDGTRCQPPFVKNRAGSKNSLPLWFNNAGKLSITLNLLTQQGRSLLRRLARTADVLVETFPPGYLKRKRLDYGSLATINPRLIVASITGFGQTGPHSHFLSNDLVSAAAGGQMYVSGPVDGTPLKMYGEQSFFFASLYAVGAIMLALQERWRSNLGQHIDISLQEVVASSLTEVMAGYFGQNEITRRMGNIHRAEAAANFPCRDGWIFITFGSEWDTLVDWMDSEGMAGHLKDGIWQDTAYRRRNAGYVVRTISRWTERHTMNDLFETAQRMRFPWAPLRSLCDLPSNPQLLERGFFAGVKKGGNNKDLLFPGLPLGIAEMTGQSFRIAAAGENNYMIYHDELGIPVKQLARWERAGII